MGIYLNPGNIGFWKSVRSEIYVDKTGLIACTNKVINTEEQCVCVSRPRRFGKSMALKMLAAYYSLGCDSSDLFKGFEIESDATFREHLNQYNVLFLNIQQFLIRAKNDDVTGYLEQAVIKELKVTYGNLITDQDTILAEVLEKIYLHTEKQFIFLIDEWDCVMRERQESEMMQKQYLDFLRDLLKDQPYVALAYMTGILPVKKYGHHSALNMFWEYSMTDQFAYEEYTGFTENEVRGLCERYDMDFAQVSSWYDGYQFRQFQHIYNPRSVVAAMKSRYFSDYWISTETYEALKVYMEMNFDGLRDKIIQLIAGGEVAVNTAKFQNDMMTFKSADDILTLLIHLGYLTFDFDKKTVRIPNGEVQQEFINSIEDGGWENVMKSIHLSEELLDATLAGDEVKVAELLEQAHDDHTSILKYNDENSLSCVISLAYYTAKKKYAVYREMPAGKGFADLVFVPGRKTDSPAMIVELKYEKSVETAMKQIKEKRYMDCLKDYRGEILLVGVEYDKNSETKKHVCRIEKIRK